MVQRAVNAEAKAGLRSSIMVRDLDAHCPRGHRSSHNTSTKVQTQSSKDSSRLKETKPKDLKSAPSCDNAVESPKKNNRKDKKKVSGVKSGNILGSEKSRLRLPTSTPPIFQKKKEEA